LYRGRSLSYNHEAVKRARNGTRDWLLIHMAARYGLRASEIVSADRYKLLIP
jgi:hypothetical protein